MIPMNKSPHKNHLIAGCLLLITHVAPSVARADALEQMARVDINSGMKDPVPFNVVKVSDGAKADPVTTNPGTPVYYSVHLPASSTWQEGSITIKPEASGLLYISFLGPHIVSDPATKQLTPVFINYDDLKCNLPIVKNGGFEKLSADNIPAAWYLNNTPGSNPPLDETNTAATVSGDAPEGCCYIRVWHNSRITQSVSVEENVPVTFTFQYRLEQ